MRIAGQATLYNITKDWCKLVWFWPCHTRKDNDSSSTGQGRGHVVGAGRIGVSLCIFIKIWKTGVNSMLMKPTDDWCYKSQRGQRNSTARPRELRNMGRRLSNEIRPRKMKVDMSRRHDEGTSGWGTTNTKSRDGWVAGSGGLRGDEVWGVLGRLRSRPWGLRKWVPLCVPGRTDYSKKTGANAVCSVGARQVDLCPLLCLLQDWALTSQPRAVLICTRHWG